MTQDCTFADFVRRIRAGDEQASAELVPPDEPAIRLGIRMRLGDPRLRRVLDPKDPGQSVLSFFFSRATVMGGTPQARRTQPDRAPDRIVGELGLERGDDV